MKYAGRNTAQIKKLNIELIRQCIKSLGYATNAEIARQTGLSISTCSNILTELVNQKEVEISEVIESNGGRPARQYHCNEDFEYKLCVFAHTTDKVNTLYYVLCNALGKEVESKLMKMEHVDAEVFIDLIGEIIERYPQTTVVGIGLPAIVSNGVIRKSDIESLVGKSLGKIIEEKFHVFVRIGNDMNYKAYGFFKNSKSSADTSLAYVTFPGDECPGCGIIVDGKVLGGVSGCAGEIQYLLQLDDQKESEIHLSPEDDIVSDAVRILVPIIAIVNPKIIALTGSMMKEEYLAEIERKCKEIIPEDCVPKIIFREDNTQDYIRGLVDLTSELRLENNLAQ